MSDTLLKKVLVVDDDAFLRATIRRMLRGYESPEVAEASDGSEAIKLIEEGFQPDLIICDVQMTPMDGMAFVNYLRGTPAINCQKTPVLLITSTAVVEHVKIAKSLGQCGYLLKPLSIKSMEERIKAVMSL